MADNPTFKGIVRLTESQYQQLKQDGQLVDPDTGEILAVYDPLTTLYVTPGTSVDIEVDDHLSTESTNPVENRAITSVIQDITRDVGSIQSVIPGDVNEQNLLASRNFVAQSITTDSANFIGTFENISELRAYSGAVTNNDYAFVINAVVQQEFQTEQDLITWSEANRELLTNNDYAYVVDSDKFDLYAYNLVEDIWTLKATYIDQGSITLNTVYNRYKAVVVSGSTTWEFEFTWVNNSFNADQWAAIDSGITEADVAQIATNTSTIASKMDSNNAVGTGSFSLGRKANTTVGINSIATGANVTASGDKSHAEGDTTVASGMASHAEGISNTASGLYSHVEGMNSTSYAMASHAEGAGTFADGNASHAEGSGTRASGQNSHAEGYYTYAMNRSQHVFGEYNILDDTANSNSRGAYVEIVGNGTGVNTRSNIRTLSWSGDETLAGKITPLGGISDGNNTTYKLTLPNTTSWTADKTIATLDDITPSGAVAETDIISLPSYHLQNSVAYSKSVTEVDLTTDIYTSDQDVFSDGTNIYCIASNQKCYRVLADGSLVRDATCIGFDDLQHTSDFCEINGQYYILYYTSNVDRRYTKKLDFTTCTYTDIDINAEFTLDSTISVFYGKYVWKDHLGNYYYSGYYSGMSNSPKYHYAIDSNNNITLKTWTYTNFSKQNIFVVPNTTTFLIRCSTNDSQIVGNGSFPFYYGKYVYKLDTATQDWGSLVTTLGKDIMPITAQYVEYNLNKYLFMYNMDGRYCITYDPSTDTWGEESSSSVIGDYNYRLGSVRQGYGRFFNNIFYSKVGIHTTNEIDYTKIYPWVMIKIEGDLRSSGQYVRWKAKATILHSLEKQLCFPRNDFIKTVDGKVIIYPFSNTDIYLIYSEKENAFNYKNIKISNSQTTTLYQPTGILKNNILYRYTYGNSIQYSSTSGSYVYTLTWSDISITSGNNMWVDLDYNLYVVENNVLYLLDIDYSTFPLSAKSVQNLGAWDSSALGSFNNKKLIYTKEHLYYQHYENESGVYSNVLYEFNPTAKTFVRLNLDYPTFTSTAQLGAFLSYNNTCLLISRKQQNDPTTNLYSTISYILKNNTFVSIWYRGDSNGLDFNITSSNLDYSTIGNPYIKNGVYIHSTNSWDDSFVAIPFYESRIGCIVYEEGELNN